MASHDGLVGVWLQGDGVTRLVLVLLLLMSLASWCVILLRALQLLRLRRFARGLDAFWRSASYAEGLEALGPRTDNPYHALALAARQTARHPRVDRQLTGEYPDLSEWISLSLRNAIDDSIAGLQGGLALLASVGATSPFVGLFGTVWGIYHALAAIGAAGQASLDQVAGPIGEALIMTALGLAVAIPAVLGYNALVRANKAVQTRLRRFADDLHAYWLTGARIGTAAAPPRP